MLVCVMGDIMAHVPEIQHYRTRAIRRRNPRPTTTNTKRPPIGSLGDGVLFHGGNPTK
jgi:hypothetical protein